MTTDKMKSQTGQKQTGQKQAGQQEQREQRLAASLRANLHRRKAQSRGRKMATDDNQ